MPGRQQRTARRDPLAPDLPADLTPGALPDDDLGNGALHVCLSFDGTDLSGRESANADIDQCRYRNVNLSHVKLRRAEVRDVVFDRCDLANLRARDCSMSRTAVLASRMTGLSWVAGGLRDVLFDGCRMDLASFHSTKLRDVVFTNCRLDQADFGDADLCGARFTDCDLTGAQFSGALMTGAQIARCELAGIGGVTSMRGATVTSADAMTLAATLAAALGIVITDDAG
jgi:uncharacterized protein YjbI with pentapeptide repeats